MDNDFTFREAGEADLGAIAELHVQHEYGPEGIGWKREDYLKWLKWKFMDNPDGPARIFVAEDSEGNIVGHRMSLPRMLSSVATGPFLAHHGLDDFIAARFRKRGLYAGLRKFTLERVKTTFGFSSPVVLHAAKKQGYYIVGPMEKWRFPVGALYSAGRSSSARTGRIAGLLARFYATIWLGQCPTDLHMRQVNRFDRDFDVKSKSIHGTRSAAYLNWRFIDNPMFRYSAHEFFDGDESIGYCVYKKKDSHAELYDFVADRRERSCLRLLIEHCRSKGFTRLNFRGIGLRLGRFGFIRRPDSMNSCIASPALPKGSWMLTLGDRDH